MPRPIPYHGGYRVNFRDPNDKSKKIQRRFETREQAQACIDSFAQIKMDPALGLREQVRRYLNWAQQTGTKKYSTIKGDRSRLNLFVQWADQNKVQAANQITVESVREFQMFFLDGFPHYKNQQGASARPNKVATWQHYFMILSAFLNWCEERLYVETNVLGVRRVRKEFLQKVEKVDRNRPFGSDELKRLFDRLRSDRWPHHELFFRLLAYTGMRLGEATTLKWKHVNYRAKTIRVTDGTKSKEGRTIPMLPQAKDALKAIPRKGDLVFDKGNGEPLLSRGRWAQILSNALSDLGLEHAGTHSFRITFATDLLEQGVPLPDVRDLLGHSSITTTMIYAKIRPAHLRKSIAKLSY